MMPSLATCNAPALFTKRFSAMTSPTIISVTPYVPSTVLTQHSPAKSLKDLRGRDLLSLTQLTKPCVLELFDLAAKMKAARARGSKSDIAWLSSLLTGKTAILIFEKASLRTRITFETGVGLLGGHAINMDHSQQRLGVRESVKDYGKNLERWLDCIVARVYSQNVIEELAEHADVPVINALSERLHPCQALADLMTLWERSHEVTKSRNDEAKATRTKSSLRHSVTSSLRHSPLRIAYVGDGNNVCHSLMHACVMLGHHITVITPKGYAPDAAVARECEQLAKSNGGSMDITTNLSAVESHHAVYTDVWVSMGQADEEGKRLRVFADYQVNAALMAKASQGLRASWGQSKFMHCLPARRGVEVTDDVIDSDASIVYDQAENRMHAQNALLAAVMAKK